MLTSTEIASGAKIIGEEKMVKLVAKAGFDAFDFSMFEMARYNWSTGSVFESDHPLRSANYLAFARKLKQIALDNGIFCNQSHAPFPVSCPDILSVQKRAIECTAEAGGKICVIHPHNYKSAEENAEMYNTLIPFADECGVKIATENMWGWDKETDRASFAACATAESFCEHIDILDNKIIACLDLGHAEMMGDSVSAVDMIYKLGHRLGALHIHDNNKHKDLHQIPFSNKIDFVPIVKALKDIGYSGEFTLEADTHLAKYSAENIFDGIKEMADAAKKLASMFEA